MNAAWKFFNSFLVRLMRLALALVVGLVLIFFFLQRDMIYYPLRSTEDELLGQAASFGLDPWRDAAGKRIGWRTQKENPTGYVLIFHGNAGHALHREGLVRILEDTPIGAGLEYFILEYPGYGSRDGKPSEAAFLEAALGAVSLLNTGAGLPLVLVGESLGTGLASLVAARKPESIRGMILLTPFDSLTGVARHHYPWLPVTLILRDRYDSMQHLPQFRGPVVFVLAGQDEVVPARLGQKLALAYAGPKLEFLVQGSDHNGVVGLLQPPQWQEILAFALEKSPH
jgi:predicted alpha/beta-hydrolase family hydrolase